MWYLWFDNSRIVHKICFIYLFYLRTCPGYDVKLIRCCPKYDKLNSSGASKSMIAFCEWAHEFCTGASFQLFLGLGGGAKIFPCLSVSMPPDYLKNWRKQHFICSNLTLFISSLLSFYSLFFSFLSLFSFFLSFFFFSLLSLGGGGNSSGPPKKAPLMWVSASEFCICINSLLCKQNLILAKVWTIIKSRKTICAMQF